MGACLAAAWLSSLGGCANSERNSAPEPAAPAAQSAPATPTLAPADDAEFTTLEQAEAALERARTDLDRLALLEPSPKRMEIAKEEAAPPPPAAAAAPAARAGSGANLDVGPSEKPAKGRAKASTRRAEGEAADAAKAPAGGFAQAPEAEAKSDNPCDTGCKAFASLLRAKAAVCRLDSPGGPRCSRAEDIAREAEGRVRSCSCQQ